MQGRSAARTVLIEMARDEARAERISSVIAQRKAEDPKYTSRYISDQVGKSERSVNAWKATGALARDNSDKLAEVLNVDPVWLWLGRKTETPDVLDLLPGAGPSHQVEEIRDEFRGKVDRVLEKLDAAEDQRSNMRSQIATQNTNLKTQTEVLERILAAEKTIAKSLEDQATIARGLDALLQRLESAGLLAPPEAGEG